jgi:hypothetical protein
MSPGKKSPDKNLSPLRNGSSPIRDLGIDMVDTGADLIIDTRIQEMPTEDNNQPKFILSRLSNLISRDSPSKPNSAVNNGDATFSAPRRLLPRTVIGGPTPSKGVKDGESIWDDDITSFGDDTQGVEDHINSNSCKTYPLTPYPLYKSNDNDMTNSEVDESRDTKICSTPIFLQSNPLLPSLRASANAIIDEVSIVAEQEHEEVSIVAEQEHEEVSIINEQEHDEVSMINEQERDEVSMINEHEEMSIREVEQEEVSIREVEQEVDESEDVDETLSVGDINERGNNSMPITPWKMSPYQIYLESQANFDSPIKRRESQANISDTTDTNPHSPTSPSRFTPQSPDSIATVKIEFPCDDDFPITPPSTPLSVPFSKSSSHRKEKVRSRSLLVSLLYIICHGYGLLMFTCTVHSLLVWYDTEYPQDSSSLFGLTSPWIGKQNATRLINRRYGILSNCYCMKTH